MLTVFVGVMQLSSSLYCGLSTCSFGLWNTNGQQISDEIWTFQGLFFYFSIMKFII